MAKFIKIHENDNVAVALETIAQGETITVDDVTVTTVNEIPAGHKLAFHCHGIQNRHGLVPR